MCRSWGDAHARAPIHTPGPSGSSCSGCRAPAAGPPPTSSTAPSRGSEPPPAVPAPHAEAARCQGRTHVAGNNTDEGQKASSINPAPELYGEDRWSDPHPPGWGWGRSDPPPTGLLGFLCSPAQPPVFSFPCTITPFTPPLRSSTPTPRGQTPPKRWIKCEQTCGKKMFQNHVACQIYRCRITPI